MPAALAAASTCALPICTVYSRNFRLLSSSAVRALRPFSAIRHLRHVLYLFLHTHTRLRLRPRLRSFLTLQHLLSQPLPLCTLTVSRLRSRRRRRLLLTIALHNLCLYNSTTSTLCSMHTLLSRMYPTYRLALALMLRHTIQQALLLCQSMRTLCHCLHVLVSALLPSLHLETWRIPLRTLTLCCVLLAITCHRLRRRLC